MKKRKYHRSTGSPPGFTLIELLIVVAIIGIIAAIAIPSLIRARLSANEAQAVGDTRTVMSSSATYAASNCGYFAPSLICMTTGNVCIPNYPANAPIFLTEDLARPVPYTKTGYIRNYIPGPGVPGNLGGNCDPASVLDFCYTSTPSQPGMSGVRAFMGSSPGAIYYNQAGVAITCPPPAGTPTI